MGKSPSAILQASTISMANRALFFGGPPYSSVLLLWQLNTPTKMFHMLAIGDLQSVSFVYLIAGAIILSSGDKN